MPKQRPLKVFPLILGEACSSIRGIANDEIELSCIFG